MSDYIYSLESHLNAFQNRIVAELQELASAANLNLYLAGGAMRDLLGGSPTRDLDFVLEGPPGKMAADLVKRLGGTIVSHDDHRKVFEMVFPGGTTAHLGMSRIEKYGKPGARPQINPAPIHEDLRRRDLTINAIALKLNRGSKGLLIDPSNGIADLTNREMRAGYSTAFYDDPTRLLRAVRLKHRLQFTVDERTKLQIENATAEKLHLQISKEVLLSELKKIGDEPSPAETVKELETTGLLTAYCKALAAGKANYTGLTKLEKLKKSLPLPPNGWTDGWRTFFILLTETLSAKDKAELVASIGMSKEDLESCKKLQVAAKKLETALKSPNLRKPSQIYDPVNGAQPDVVLYVLFESTQRLVQDRIRNYIQKYLPLVQEIPEEEFVNEGIVAGSKNYDKNRAAFIAAKLNARPKKVEETFAELPPPPSAPRGRPPRSI
jgi:tRNA nucleotidyltransferase (CCA-adding enzyme)